MAEINNEVKAMFEKQLAVIATASKEGVPNVGPKGSMYVVDVDTIAYSEGTGEKTLKNIQQNQKVAVLVVDKEKGDGYQVKGNAEILTGGEVFEKLARRNEERGRPRPKTVVKIKVVEIYSVKPGMTAKPIV
jgi:predicted pyridoxine 5'-phosphate oxidase superfamily flavin-nucleotide-binding protein